MMKVIDAEILTRTLPDVVRKVLASKEAVEVQHTSGNVVIMPVEEWENLEEMFFLYRVPGLIDSLKESMNAPLDSFSTELEV